MEYLDGGRVNQIARIGDTIHRPGGAWTPYIHKLLHHVRSKGVLGVPEPLGFDHEGHEIVSYISGEVSNYPLSASASSREALISAAELLRAYHDASASFISTLHGNEPWLLPAREPAEVICHGDYAPYNVVLHGKKAVAIIDFDTAHPAPRLWDIAYAVYRWVPLKHPDNPDSFGDEYTKITRTHLFCHAYGLSQAGQVDLISTAIHRLRFLVEFMQSEADAGNEAFKANIADGHHLLYLEDITYLNTYGQEIQKSLLSKNTANTFSEMHR